MQTADADAMSDETKTGVKLINDITKNYVVAVFDSRCTGWVKKVSC